MHSPRLPALVALVSVLAALLASGCSGCRKKTDAELAAEERKRADDLWQKSFALLPWRAIKGSVRSRKAPNRPPIYDKVDATLAVLEAPSKGNAEADASARTTACIDLLGYLVIHRSDLTKYDEDLFPRLANVLDDTQPPLPAPWYDNAAEHLVVAFMVLVMDAADRGDRVPARDIAFYELSRAPAQPGWPTEFRLGSRYARGMTYLEHALHYAAEEELGFYIDETEKASPQDLALLPPLIGEAPTNTKLLPHQVAREGLLALGHFTRAYNRMKLERDDPATEDLAAGLESLDRLGIENELTLWAHAIVFQRRGKYDESARALEKLGESAYLDEEAKKEIRTAAAEVRKHGKDPGWFHKQRTQAAVIQAVIARLGGVEGIAGFFVGKEKAHRWIAPFTLMSAAREALRDAAASNKDRFAGLTSEGTESAKKALGGLKEKVAEAGVP